MQATTGTGNLRSQAAMRGMELAGELFGKMIFTSGKAFDRKV
jgi:hypothetical protein